jgi:soluble lytic murein transglycosylase-like protein
MNGSAAVVMRDWALTLAFIDVESAFRRDAFLNDRNGGSFGLGQIDLPTAQWAGYMGDGPGLLVPRVNIRELCAILDKLTADLAAHNIFTVNNLAAAYNSGLQHVLDGGTDAPYVAKINEAFGFYSALNRTSP